MTFADVLRFVMRAVHIGATSVWLGSGLLYLLVRPSPGQTVKPASTSGTSGTSGTGGAGAARGYGSTMRMLAGRSFALTVLSGVYLTFDRLANPRLGLVYVGVLAAKLAIVAGIALIVSLRPSRREAGAEGPIRPSWASWAGRYDPGWQVLALGAAALLLGVVLTLIYEAQAGI